MKTSFTICITIIGLCFLLARISFADGGGVKMVQDDDLNTYCQNTLPSITTDYNGPEIKGTFTAHEDKDGYTAHVFLEGTKYGVQRVSQIGMNYTIYIPRVKKKSLPICDYENKDLMERYIDYACKREVDKDFGYAERTAFPSIISIIKTNEANCKSGFDDPENMPMISGDIIIKMSSTN